MKFTRYRILRKMLRRLERDVSAGLAQRPQDQTELPKVMARLFCDRLVESAKTIHRVGKSLDVVLVARSMFEGMANLVYANADITVRPHQWHEYITVTNWKRHKRLAKDGTAATADEFQRIDAKIKASPFYAVWFPEKGRPADNWRGKSVQETISCVVNDWNERHKESGSEPASLQVMYGQVYAQQSAWHHWDAGGFSRVQDSAGAEQAILGAIGTGIHSLYEGARVANSLLDLGIDDALAEHGRDFARIIADVIHQS